MVMEEKRIWKFGQVPDIGREVAWVSKMKDHLSGKMIDKIACNVEIEDEKSASQFKSVFWMYWEDFNMPAFPWEKLAECPYCHKDCGMIREEAKGYKAGGYHVQCTGCGYRGGEYPEANGAAMAHNAVTAEYKKKENYEEFKQ